MNRQRKTPTRTKPTKERILPDFSFDYALTSVENSDKVPASNETLEMEYREEHCLPVLPAAL